MANKKNKSEKKDRKLKRKQKRTSKTFLHSIKENFSVFINRPVNKIVLKFFGLICLFYIIWLSPFFQNTVIIKVSAAYASLCAVILNIFQYKVSAVGDALNSTLFSMQIKNGCDAIEAIAILLCAILIYPAHWRQKIIGLLMGSLILVLLNIIRIISLYFTGIYIPSIFEIMHVSVWQAIFIVFPLIIIARWISWMKLKNANAGI